MNRFLISTASALALMAGAAQAQDGADTQEEGVTTLEAINVTANRTPTEKSKTGSKVEQVTQGEIETKSLVSVTDYLTRLPGIAAASTGGIGTQTGIYMRGAPGRYVKTLYNGIDISDPANTQVQTHYEHLLTGGISGIEVLKGSQSTLYGSNAIAGVVDITTIGQISEGISHTIELEGGSFGTVKGRYGFAAAHGDSRITANASGFRTDGISAADGFPERDGYDNITLDLAAEHRINEAFSVFGSLLYIDTKGEYDTDGADNLVNFGTSKIMAGRVGFNLDLMDGRLKNTFSMQAFEMEREDTNEFFGMVTVSNYTGKRQKFDYQGSFEVNEKILLQYGADHERQQATVAGWSPLDDKHHLTGVWAQAVVAPIDDFVITAGLRHDEHSEFGGYTTYRGTASYLLPGMGTRLHSSIGTGFRAPSLAELYEIPTGNPDLQPETSLSFDFGVEQSFMGGRLTADLTYFQLEVDNLIVSRFPNPYDQIAGTTRSRGIEASFSYAVNEWLDLGGSYTYTDSRDSAGVRTIRVPRHLAALSAVARPAEKWTVSADLKFVADTLDTDFAVFPSVRVALKDHVLLNAKVAYQLNDSTQIYLRGENLLDQDYQTAANYGTPGIAAYAGFKAKF